MITKKAFSFSKSISNHRLFLFAGQGTQQEGMLNAIPSHQKEQVLNLAQKLLGIDFNQISTTDADKQINQTQITQPLLVISHYLHFRKGKYHNDLSSQDWMIGHSLGQYSALVNAESLELDEALKLVNLRGRLMKKYTNTPHGMLIVKYKPEKEDVVYEEINKAGLQVACINTKTSIIVAGEIVAIRQLMKVLKTHQAAALSLPVSNAFHCKILAGMNDQFREALSKTRFLPPKCKVIRNYDCLPFTNQQNIRQGLLLQLTNPVRFAQSVQKVPLSTQVIEISHRPWILKFAEQVRRSSFLNDLI